MSRLSNRITPASIGGPSRDREAATLGAVREPLDDVFITPRVLDKSAFDQFASQLKGLIDQATAQHQHVKAAVAAAEGVLKQFAQIGPLFESKLTGATKALATVEAKAGELAALARKVEERQSSAQQLEAKIESILTQKLADFEQRLSQRLNEATQTLERSKGELATRATALQSGLTKAVEQAQEHVTGLAKGVESRLNDKRKEIDSHTAELEARLTRISDEMTKYAGPGLTALTGLCDRAEKLLGPPIDGAADAAPKPGSAAAILKELQILSDRAGGGLSQAKRDLDSLTQQADIACGTLSGAINGAAPRIDELQVRLDRVGNGLQHAQNTADSLERRREQIKSTMLEALELAESVQSAVREQLAASKQQIAHEVDIMRETLAAAAMAHGHSARDGVNAGAALFGSEPGALEASNPEPASRPRGVPILIEEPKPTQAGGLRRGQ